MCEAFKHVQVLSLTFRLSVLVLPRDASALLFTLYTNDSRNHHSNNYIFKFSDDTAILSLLTVDSDIAVYKSEIESCVQWCEEHNLVLNVKKTKEMVFDPRSTGDHSAVFMNEQRVEQVTVHKCR